MDGATGRNEQLGLIPNLRKQPEGRTSRTPGQRAYSPWYGGAYCTQALLASLLRWTLQVSGLTVSRPADLPGTQRLRELGGSAGLCLTLRTNTVLFTPQAGNSSIAWSLGYMLSLTNQIPAESPLIHLPIEPPVFVGLLAFFAAAALLCLVFLLYLCSVSRTKKHSVQAFDHAVDSE